MKNSKDNQIDRANSKLPGFRAPLLDAQIIFPVYPYHASTMAQMLEWIDTVLLDIGT